MKLILAAAAFALLSIGGAQAADPVVPTTGSAQGITVSHALPGEPTHDHNPAIEGHLTAPTGQLSQASEQGVNPENSVPGSAMRLGDYQPHNEVASPRGVVPEVGSAHGANPANTR